MPTLTPSEIGANKCAFLDTIAESEIGADLLAVSDNGYNVCVGSTPSHPILFPSYAEHPRIRNAALNSDAAGRYQFMGRYWLHYKNQLDLPDFGPESQDRWALCLIGECDALGLIQRGRFDEAILACKSRWASFPGAGYNQHENPIEPLRAAYIAAGGTVT